MRQWLTGREFTVVIFLLTVFLLALNKIHDPDAWMHLAAGREFVRLHGLPSAEPWDFTTVGGPFSYVPWLFALFYYSVFHWLGITGVVLCKALVVTLGFALLLSDAQSPRRMPEIAVIVLTLTALVTRFRFVERPDTFMMVYLAFEILALRAFVQRGRRLIFAMPAIGLLWANTHTSISLLTVPFVAYLAGGVVQRFAAKQGVELSLTASWDQLKTIAWLFGGTLAASLVNPYFLEPWLGGASVLGSAWHSQEIQELQRTTWEVIPWFFVLVALLAFSFLLNWRETSLVELLMAAPFVVLGLLARRFTFVFAIVAAPLLARNLMAVAERLRISGPLRTRSTRIVVALATVTLGGLGWENVGPFAETRQAPGIGVNYEVVPEAALAFMDRWEIEGRIFNRFEMGGYIIWRDFPRRVPFVDGRGGLPSSLLEKYEKAFSSTAVFDELDRIYSFDAVLLKYYQIPEELSSQVDLCLSNPEWSLVYWDDQALVYLRTRGRYANVVERAGYRFVRPCNGLPSLLDDMSVPEMRTGIIDELRRNVDLTDSSRGWALLGAALHETGHYQEALEAFAKVRGDAAVDFRALAYSGMGHAYLRLGRYEEAIRSYKRSYTLNRYPGMLAAIGIAYEDWGELQPAAESLQKSIDEDPKLASAYPRLARIYRRLGREAEARMIEERHKVVRLEEEGGAHFKAGLRAYFDRDLATAAREFEASVRANPGNASAFGNLGFVYFDLGNLDKALEYHRKAVSLDPNQANSHYGLAMVYEATGDVEMARKEWREYLRLEPTGYYSRRAQEHLQRIGR